MIFTCKDVMIYHFKPIKDKGFKISRNCSFFIKHTNNGDITYKLYNKIVQSLERPSVKKLVDSDISDYTCNTSDELKNSIYASKRYWNSET